MEGEGEQPVTVVELFSGIGGWSHALRLAGVSARVVAAFDSNQNANSAYKETFGLAPVATDIATLPASRLAAHAWLLSPPCQPFTLSGKHLDDEDPRSAALLHLVRVIASGHGPRVLALENVPLFAESRCRERLIEALRGQKMELAEYVVSPDQTCAVPNRRLRYYLVAARPEFAPKGGFPAEFPSQHQWSGSLREYFRATGGEEVDAKKVAELPPAWTEKNTGFRFHCVSLDGESTVTQCMTKAYFENKNSGGSYVRQDIDNAAACFETDVSGMHLRFFSPREAFLLMGFPPGLSMLETVGTKSLFKLLGNSLNPKVCAVLLKLLFGAPRCESN